MIALLATLQLVIFFGYAYYIYKRFGVLGSISESTYKLSHQETWKFSLALFATAILQVPILIIGELSTLLFLPMLGLAYTGFTTLFRKGIQKTIHYYGVVGAIIIQFTVMGFAHDIWLPLVFLVPLLIGTYYDEKENFIWWAELEVMLFVWMGYMLI